jgi:transcriptional regulator with XRE-family HTH domain
MAGGDGRKTTPLSLPLAEFIRDELTKRGLTLEQAAAGIQEAGWKADRYSRCSKQLVWCWCNGTTPGPSHRWIIARFLNVPVAVITTMAEQQRRRRKLSQGEVVQDKDVDRRAFLRLSLGLSGTALGGLAEPELSRLLYDHGDRNSQPAVVILDELNVRVFEAWNLWLNKPDRFTAIAAMLPQLAKDIEQAVRQFKSPQEESQRRRAYNIAAHHYSLLRSFFRAAQRYDLATQAADRGVLAAEAADDSILMAAAKWSLATVLLIDERSALGEEIALEAARTIAPMTDDSSRASAIYGALHLTAASAAVRNDGDLANARKHIWTEAEPVASKRGEINLLWTQFGSCNLHVIATGVEMEARNPIEALRLADKVNADKLPSVERSGTHFLEVAGCYDQLAEDAGVLHYLLRSETVMPEDMRYHPLSKPLIESLLMRSRPSIRQEVEALANRVGIYE